MKHEYKLAKYTDPHPLPPKNVIWIALTILNRLNLLHILARDFKLFWAEMFLNYSSHWNIWEWNLIFAKHFHQKEFHFTFKRWLLLVNWKNWLFFSSPLWIKAQNWKLNYNNKNKTRLLVYNGNLNKIM